MSDIIERSDEGTPEEILKWLEAPYKYFHKMLCRPEDLILDCASGNGVYTKDMNVVSVDQGQTDAKNLFIWDLLKNKGCLPFPSEHFDVVFSFETIEHLPKELHSRFVAELIRVSRKYVVVGTVMADGLDVINGVPIFKASLGNNPHHIKEYSVAEFRSFMKKFHGSIMVTNSDYQIEFFDNCKDVISAHAVIAK